MTTIGHHGLLLGAGGVPPGLTLFDELMADGPVNYWRNGEPNTAGGMIDEVAPNGSYVGTPSLGNAALYSGGGTSITSFNSVNLGTSSSFPAALTELCLISVVKFNAVSGFQPIGAQRDQNGSTRKYQLVANGAGIDFVRIEGSIGVYRVTGILSSGVSYIVGCEVDSSGNVTIYLNGVAQSGSWVVGSASAADYGGGGDLYQIGYFDGGAVSLNGFTCDNAVFDYLPGATRQAAYATAAGL